MQLVSFTFLIFLRLLLHIDHLKSLFRKFDATYYTQLNILFAGI